MNNILDQNLVLKDKKVLLRVDLNVPMKNRAITETSRIEKIIPTIKLLIEKQAKIIILSHIGRPKGKVVEGMSLKPISEKLSFLLNKSNKFFTLSFRISTSRCNLLSTTINVITPTIICQYSFTSSTIAH